MIAASGCWAKRSAVAVGELVGVGAGGVELAQQGQGLLPEGLLDQRRVVQVVGAQHLLEPVGFGVDAALPPGAAQQRPQLGQGQPGRRARGGGGGQQRRGLRGAAARRACWRTPARMAGVVLAQQRAQLVVRVGRAPRPRPAGRGRAPRWPGRVRSRRAAVGARPGRCAGCWPARARRRRRTCAARPSAGPGSATPTSG